MDKYVAKQKYMNHDKTKTKKGWIFFISNLAMPQVLGYFRGFQKLQSD